MEASALGWLFVLLAAAIVMPQTAAGTCKVDTNGPVYSLAKLPKAQLTAEAAHTAFCSALDPEQDKSILAPLTEADAIWKDHICHFFKWVGEETQDSQAMIHYWLGGMQESVVDSEGGIDEQKLRALLGDLKYPGCESCTGKLDSHLQTWAQTFRLSRLEQPGTKDGTERFLQLGMSLRRRNRQGQKALVTKLQVTTQRASIQASIAERVAGVCGSKDSSPPPPPASTLEKGVTDVIFVRHGESEWNKKKEDAAAGNGKASNNQPDVPLTPAGIDDAIRAGEEINKYLISEDLAPSALMVSNLDRAEMTGALLALQIANPWTADVYITSSLQETSGGTDAESILEANEVRDLGDVPDGMPGVFVAAMNSLYQKADADWNIGNHNVANRQLFKGYISDFPKQLAHVGNAGDGVVLVAGHSHWYAKFMNKYGDDQCKNVHIGVKKDCPHLDNGMAVRFTLTTKPGSLGSDTITATNCMHIANTGHSCPDSGHYAHNPNGN